MAKTTWYVIADGGKARIATLSGGQMHPLHRFDNNSGHGDAAEDPSAGTSQLKAPKSDPHDQAKAHFATQVAARLNEAVRTGEIDEIVLAAPGACAARYSRRAGQSGFRQAGQVFEQGSDEYAGA